MNGTVDSPGLLVLVVVAATLYSAVGQGGGSGYLAAMALYGLDPAAMKPAALSLNVFVSALVLVRLWRAGHFDGRLFWPFALPSIPMAALGGAWTLSAPLYRYLVAAALTVAAVQMLRGQGGDGQRGRPPLTVALALGAGLGLVSGLTGVGGGVFLAPLVLIFGWARMRSAAALSAGFILVNSLAALAGYATSGQPWPEGLVLLVPAAVLGAVAGSELAVRGLSPRRLQQVLGLVLLLAAARLIVS